MLLNFLVVCEYLEFPLQPRQPFICAERRCDEHHILSRKISQADRIVIRHLATATPIELVAVNRDSHDPEGAWQMVSIIRYLYFALSSIYGRASGWHVWVRSNGGDIGGELDSA